MQFRGMIYLCEKLQPVLDLLYELTMKTDEEGARVLPKHIKTPNMEFLLITWFIVASGMNIVIWYDLVVSPFFFTGRHILGTLRVGITRAIR